MVKKTITPHGAGQTYEPESRYRVELNRTVVIRRIVLRPGNNLIVEGSLLNEVPPENIISANRV